MLTNKAITCYIHQEATKVTLSERLQYADFFNYPN